MKHLAWLIAASVALSLPGLAKATDAYVTRNVNVRAGPDASYPLVGQLQAGSGVDVQGCTADWEWCDVIAFGNRGWVAGNFIEYEYQDQPVLLPTYGARIGVPIITFSIGTYWDSYYRSRPFYSRRTYWYQRPVVRRPPPPPVRHPYRGPVRHSNGPARPASGSHGHTQPALRPQPASRPQPTSRPQPASRPKPHHGLSPRHGPNPHHALSLRHGPNPHHALNLHAPSRSALSTRRRLARPHPPSTTRTRIRVSSPVVD